MTQLYSIGIQATGIALPKHVVTNKDMEKIVDTSDEWITTKIGIKERRFCSKDEALSDYAITAAKNALTNAKLNGKDIDLIIIGAMSHDHIGISTGNYVKKAIGATNALVYDINTICAGFIYCVELAKRFMQTGDYKHALVINGETFSKYEMTRVTSVIFGDGAGAVILGLVDEHKGLLASYLRSKEQKAEQLGMVAGGSRFPPSKKTIETGMHAVQMDGHAIYDFAMAAFPEAVNGVLKKINKNPTDIDFIISHQANLNIINQSLDALQIPKEKTYTNIQKYGNIGGGSVIIALHEALQKKLIKPGDLVIFVAFGAGLQWGALAFSWNKKTDFK